MYRSFLLSISLFAVSTVSSPKLPRNWNAPTALYYITNDASNAVVSLHVAEDGTLSKGTTTSTGGAGLHALNATGQVSGGDALFSQSAVNVVDNNIFVVNGGSNSVSMLKIDSQNPTKLTLIGQPSSSAGTFPVSVSASSRHGIVCVTNSGAQAGVSCASYSITHGIGPFTLLQSFPLGQTTPPTGPANTVSQVFFDDYIDALYVTVKGVPMTTNHGFIASYGVQNGKVSSTGKIFSPSVLALPFGAALVPFTGGNVVVSDPSIGSALINLTPNSHQGSVVAVQNITGQSATCWATYSPTTRTVFLADGGLNRFVEVDGRSGARLRTFNSTNGNPGNLDMVAKGKFLFALSPGAGAIAVIDISGQKIRDVQNYKPTVESLNAMGMAAY